MLLYHKYAIIDRQHLIKFIILLLLLTRKGKNAFGHIQDVFPKICNMSSGVSTYIEGDVEILCKEVYNFYRDF